MMEDRLGLFEKVETPVIGGGGNNSTDSCKNIKVLLTGITGFIGSNLAERLLNNGHEVFAIVRPTSKIAELPENLCRNVKFFTYGEISLSEVFQKISADSTSNIVVYHLASNYLYSHNFDDIKNLIQSNITFGTELLDAMDAVGIKNFINVGSHFQHYENEGYSPVNLYAATKQAFEKIIDSYVREGKLKCISLHLFDTYGKGDKRRKVLDLLKKIADSGETLKMSPGEQLIDMVYIDDVVDAFILAGKYLAEQKYDYCGIYGVGSMNPIPLRNVVKIFEEVSGKKLSIEWGGRPYRDREVMIPWTNFKTLPGWSPKVNLREGIKKFLEG